MKAARIPIISLYGNLIVPVQGAIGEQAIMQLSDDVAQAISQDGARGLVIDVSGIAFMDSFVTRNIRDLALTASLMGIATMVSGLTPAVAITLIEMGLDIHDLETALNLERALERLTERRIEQDALVAGTDGPR